MTRMLPAVFLLLAAPLAAQPGPVEATSLLGTPLRRPALSPAAADLYQRNLTAARRAWAHTPTDADSIIWYGRRLAYLGQYQDAIAMFGEGIAIHPDDARLYRHRGHRQLTVRNIDEAIRDFERAYDLTRGRPDEIEPDGIPNAQGIPTSTLQGNIRYHLGLAHYLRGEFEKSLSYYREDVAAAVNPDMVVATTHWLYMALRRLGRDTEAAAVLEPISADMPIIENGSYHRLLLMYKGAITPAAVATAADQGDAVQDATIAYGVGNWHLYHGRTGEATRIFERILAMPQWGAFGYLAAEADLARLRQAGGVRPR